MSVPTAVLFFREGAQLSPAMAETLRRELAQDRLALTGVSAARREDVPSLPWELPFIPAEMLSGTEAELVFLLEDRRRAAGSVDTGKDRLKRMLPPFALRAARRVSSALLGRRNLQRWEGYDGWGKPLPPPEEDGGRGYAPLGQYAVPGEKTAPGRVLEVPGFRTEEYLRLRREGVSFVSDNCWGGLMYNTLGMEMQSPFINMFIRREHFYRLLGNLSYYMAQPLVPLRPRQGTLGADVYPIAALGDVEIHLNHVHSPVELEDYARQWYRRAARFRPDRVMVQTCFENAEEWEQYRDAFAAVAWSKIGFAPFPVEEEDVVYLPEAGEFKDGVGECARALAKNDLPVPYDFLDTYLTGKLCPPIGEN